MKKGQIILLFLALFLPLVSAADIQLSKPSYFPGETLQAEITGDFISLKSENIQIFKQGVPRELPSNSALTRQGDIYYFYAVLPLEETNYTLKILGSEYLSSGDLISEPIIKEFSIEKTNKSYLSFNPGFIIANKDFSIKIKSFNENINLAYIVESTAETKNISLSRDIEKTIDFSISSFDANTNIKMKDYKIPVFVNKISGNYTSPMIESSDLIFIPNEINAVISPETNYFFKIILKNSGEKNLTGIVLSSDLNATINPSEISFLQTGDSVPINITIRIPKKSTDISGQITSDYQTKTSILPISLQITKKPNEVNLSGTSLTDAVACSKIGMICLETEECDGKTTASSEGPCCIGTCKEIKVKNYSFITGIVLVVLLLIVVGYFYIKIKKKQKLKSTDEMLDEKSKKYNNRMKLGEEVSGELDRV